MFIPWENIFNTIAKYSPEKIQGQINSLGQNLKVKQNLRFIKRNQKKLIPILKKKFKKEKLNVAFYVYDETKWKCQSVYEAMDKSKNFVPYIFVTKNAAPKENCNSQSNENFEKVVRFFESKKMRTLKAFDTKNNKHIAFEKINPKPDIIIYQHPWYVETSQGPVICSKFALTYYVPYFISDTDEFFEYGLRFHKYIHKYYVPNNIIKQSYSEKMDNRGGNLVTVGHPQLDFYFNNPNMPADKKYIIYAPHWTVCGDNIRYSTFNWSGYEILEYAKQHPEFNWVMKPHPLLYNFLQTSGYMTKEETDEYFNSWRKIGEINDSGNYLELFNQSEALITDSGSFLIEYFPTNKPVIQLVSEHFKGNKFVNKIREGYYKAHNQEEMYNLLETIIINKQDSKKEIRELTLQQLNINRFSAADNIIKDIIQDLC